MKTIPKDELAAKLGSPDLVAVNVPVPVAYSKIHIKGSLSMPQSQLQEGRWKELDRRRETVTHCSSFTCNASREAADFLESQGYNVRAYERGMKEWVEAGLPAEGRPASGQFLAEKYGKSQATPATV